jgi:hypothetical protein
MDTQEFYHRDYKIQLTHNPPVWQAAIYPTRPKQPSIDWTNRPIEAASVRPTLIAAMIRIDEVLGPEKPATP